MKRFLALGLTALLAVFGLSGCGCDGGGNIDLVFINDSDTAIVAVIADFTNDRTEGIRHADSSPLERGESFGFEAGGYPVTVVVCDRVVDRFPEREKELARIVIREAPPAGRRWYVTARDGTGGLKLAAETSWPEGV